MMWNIQHTLREISEDIKLHHTIFALPFAILSAVMAGAGNISFSLLFLIILALFFARSSAMAFNRIVDARYDALNQRTCKRALPAGKVSRRSYLFFFFFTSLLFILTAANMNTLAFTLSPIALFIICFYSYCKRFTSLSHLVLGLALALAPVGAWVAVTGTLSLTSLLLGGAVMFWLAGFDILYSLQDMEFDRKAGLHSIPQAFGVRKSLMIARFFHVAMVSFLLLIPLTIQVGVLYYIGVLVCAALLLYEHSLVGEEDLSRINIAFFNVNGTLSFLFMLFIILDTL